MKKYVILDIGKSSIVETPKAFSVALVNGGTGRDIGRAWFPKSQCKIYHPQENSCANRVEVIIPMWLALQKTNNVEFIEGFNRVWEGS